MRLGAGQYVLATYTVKSYTVLPDSASLSEVHKVPLGALGWSIDDENEGLHHFV